MSTTAEATDPILAESTKPTLDHEDTLETAELGSLSSNSGRSEEATLPDEEAMKRAKEHMKNEQVLVAARLLRHMTHIPEEDAVFRTEVEEKAAQLEGVIADLLTDPLEQKSEGGGEGWIPMGESHNGHRDTVSYYQLTEDLQLKCRLETPIESSLLVPLISVLVETDLYTSWLPRWTVPRIGLASVEKLAQLGRTEQIVHFISEVPWPFSGRDVVLQTCACDDIDDLDGPTTGSIAISLRSLKGGDQVRRSVVCNEHYLDAPEVLLIEESKDGLKRADFEGGLLFRKCPEDHVALRKSKIEYPKDEHLLLVGFSMRIDGKISPMFPKTIINFVIQTAIVQMWAMFLKVAEEIRSGGRPLHDEAIAAKREQIYDWVDQRIKDMFEHLEKHQATAKNNQGDAETEEKKDEKDVATDAN